MTFPSGWRPIPDPEAEMRRLADERGRLETVPVPRRDLDVLLSVASAVLHADGPGPGFLPLPDGIACEDVEAVVKRHGRRY